MNIKVIRNVFTGNSSGGDLYINGIFMCNTLEPPDRGLLQSMSLEQIEKLKIKGDTAIPYGIYSIELYLSPKHNMEVPLYKNVPGFDFVEMHIGNFETGEISRHESDGCTLIGIDVHVKDFIANSKKTYQRIFPLIKKAIDNKEKVQIEFSK